MRAAWPLARGVRPPSDTIKLRGPPDTSTTKRGPERAAAAGTNGSRVGLQRGGPG